MEVALQEEARRSWKKKDKGTSKKRENAVMNKAIRRRSIGMYIPIVLGKPRTMTFVQHANGRNT